MTRETLSEILRELTPPTEDAFVFDKGREIAVHVGRPGEGLAVGPVSRVELRKQHVRISTSRGQQFLTSYEDIALVSIGLDGRSGFGS